MGGLRNEKYKFFYYLQSNFNERAFSCRLRIVGDSTFWKGMGTSFHQPGMVKENVLESDFVLLCGGTMAQCSLVDLRLLEVMYSRYIRVS